MSDGRNRAPVWKRVTAYGALLAAGTLGLQWLDHRHFARAHGDEIAIALIAGAFLVLGIMIGIHVFAPRAPRP